VGDPANDQVGSSLGSISWRSISDNVLAWSVHGDNHREVCGPRGRRIAGTSSAHVLAQARAMTSHSSSDGYALTHIADIAFAKAILLLEVQDACTHDSAVRETLSTHLGGAGSAGDGAEKTIIELGDLNKPQPTLLVVPDGVDSDLRAAIWGDILAELEPVDGNKAVLVRIAALLAYGISPTGVSYVSMDTTAVTTDHGMK
jgi:hypothetical protein